MMAMMMMMMSTMMTIMMVLFKGSAHEIDDCDADDGHHGIGV
jgi:hypothetical protein